MASLRLPPQRVVSLDPIFLSQAICCRPLHSRSVRTFPSLLLLPVLLPSTTPVTPPAVPSGPPPAPCAAAFSDTGDPHPLPLLSLCPLPASLSSPTPATPPSPSSFPTPAPCTGRRCLLRHRRPQRGKLRHHLSAPSPLPLFPFPPPAPCAAAFSDTGHPSLSLSFLSARSLCRCLLQDRRPLSVRLPSLRLFPPSFSFSLPPFSLSFPSACCLPLLPAPLPSPAPAPTAFSDTGRRYPFAPPPLSFSFSLPPLSPRYVRPASSLSADPAGSSPLSSPLSLSLPSLNPLFLRTSASPLGPPGLPLLLPLPSIFAPRQVCLCLAAAAASSSGFCSGSDSDKAYLDCNC